MAEDALRFAVTGYGHIGRRHAALIAGHPGWALAAVCDIADVTVAQTGVPLYGDHDEMLVAVSPDIVCICTPNGLHATQSISALEHGAHVLCEKPLALDPDDARRMANASERAGRSLVCVLQNRYSPQVQWLKEIIGTGLLGNVYQVHVHCFWNRDERYYLLEDGTRHPWRGTLALDGGPMFTQFSHFVDLLIWIFDIRETSDISFANHRHRSTTEFEDSGSFHFGLPAGGTGSFHYSIAVWDRNQESSITIIGEHGSIRIGGQYMNRVEYCHIRDYKLPHLDPGNGPNDYGTHQGSAANHRYVLENLADAVQGKASPDFDLADAVRGVSLIASVYRHRDIRQFQPAEY